MTVLETVASRRAPGRAAKLILTGERTPGLIIAKGENEPSSLLCSMRPSFALTTVWDEGKKWKRNGKVAPCVGSLMTSKPVFVAAKSFDRQ